MTADEIIAKVNEALQDSTIAPTITDVNSAVAFIAAQTHLPDLVMKNAIKFSASTHTITDATNTSPIVVSTNVAHGLVTGDIVVVTDIVGNTNANSTWYIEVLTTTTLSLLTSEGNGAYVSGGTLTKRDACIDMPTNYDHDLFEAFSISQDKKLNIRSNMRAMDILNSADDRLNGDVIEDVAVEGSLLYGMPSGKADDVVMCKYYRKPNTLTLGTESPDCIPDHLHEPIVVQYILMKKWLLIEDDMDGATPNTDRAGALFSAGIAGLNTAYPRPSITQPIIKRNLQYF